MATFGLGIAIVEPVEARPTNTGNTISGCTYCHTGRTPVPSTTTPPQTTTTEAGQTDPEDESSDKFRGFP